MTLGEKIQILRKQHGLSQEQLAEKITISRQAVSKWELGESMPDIDNVVQLSKVFDVSTDYLLKNGISVYSDTDTNTTSNENVPSQTNLTTHTVLESTAAKVNYDKDEDSEDPSISFVYIITTLIYLCLGFFLGLWHPGWLVYLIATAYVAYKRGRKSKWM